MDNALEHLTYNEQQATDVRDNALTKMCTVPLGGIFPEYEDGKSMGYFNAFMDFSTMQPISNGCLQNF